MKNRVHKILATLPLVVGAPWALAADVSIAWQGNVAQAGVALTAMDLTVSTTDAVFDDLALELRYTNLTTGSSFSAFCVEPLAGNSTLPATYSVGSFSGAEGTHLAALYQTAYSTSLNATQQAAFQLAVWEFTQEQPGANGVVSFGTQTGNFRADAPAAVSNLADSYIAGALNYTGHSSYNVVRLSSADYQDLVVASVVPEPESYALFLGGLGVVGLLARRRLPR